MINQDCETTATLSTSLQTKYLQNYLHSKRNQFPSSAILFSGIGTNCTMVQRCNQWSKLNWTSHEYSYFFHSPATALYMYCLRSNFFSFHTSVPESTNKFSNNYRITADHENVSTYFLLPRRFPPDNQIMCPRTCEINGQVLLKNDCHR